MMTLHLILERKKSLTEDKSSSKSFYIRFGDYFRPSTRVQGLGSLALGFREVTMRSPIFLCKTCSVLLCMLEQPRVENSSAEQFA